LFVTHAEARRPETAGTKILFPHSRLIAAAENIAFKQGEAIKHGAPVLMPDHSWEGLLSYVYGTVLRTTIYRMWYQANGIHVAYAYSRDGLRWQKPRLSRHPIDGTPTGATVALTGGGAALCAEAKPFKPASSNIVSTLHMPSIVYDPCDRRRRYKLFGYSDQGYRAAFSQDGIRFTAAQERPVIPLIKFRAPSGRKTWFSDVAPVYRDWRTGRYVSHVKTYETDAAGRVRRCVGYAESSDFLSWSEPKTIWAPGDDEDRLAQSRGYHWADFYGLCGFNWGDGYLGLLWLFLIDHEIPAGTHEGRIEVYLASSADGKRWHRFSDLPLIPLSDSGWDSGMITTANLPVFTARRILLYYGGSNMSHGAGEPGNPYDESAHRFNVGLATLRRDGFVYACSESGRLVTRAMACRKGSIKVNADATEGKLKLTVKQNDRPLERFELTGVNVVDRTLRTRGREAISLEILIENARLYSVEVR
jgi:hypothetical protein